MGFVVVRLVGTKRKDLWSYPRFENHICKSHADLNFEEKMRNRARFASFLECMWNVRRSGEYTCGFMVMKCSIRVCLPRLGV
ncbi:hypothetical protein M758_UG269500 [Ceratodon purpureus]|uniref:Uncharacterized protein n=1 Tax=Ceratodon purpureus TaxID=3225 RepID=A0A8T0I260_CERPU|nr:hypothetical protein KC19_5G126800 [Ceratodon purpureus]KAG0577039.1 hypothetical protein KC19_5G126800 [Ceratodon purpureus]KAG0596602.1 hypothetical protein M758_UG269500 [Ceratodon purpureus]